MERHHHFLELLVVNQFVLIFIEFLYEILPLMYRDFLFRADSHTHHRLKLFDRDLASVLVVVIQVKQIECVFQVKI